MRVPLQAALGGPVLRIRLRQMPLRARLAPASNPLKRRSWSFTTAVACRQMRWAAGLIGARAEVAVGNTNGDNSAILSEEL